MDAIVKEMLDFLATATPEQLKEDWEEMSKYNYGPLAADYIDNEMAVNTENVSLGTNMAKVGMKFELDGIGRDFSSSVFCLAA